MTGTANSIDTARVELLLSELRLPGVKAIWPKLAALADKEGALADRQDAHDVRLRERAYALQGAGDGVGRWRRLAQDGRQLAAVWSAGRRQKPSIGGDRPCARRERVARSVRAHDRSGATATGGAA